MSEPTHEAPANEQYLNRIVIIDALNEIGIDVSLKDWIDYGDQQVMNELASYAHWLDIGFEDFLEYCKIEIVNTGEEHEV